ncbi:unnamed protein product [Mytilus coruscus]|uniref:B box-type domain-containing protein n=1 Tax=Mytilus coruscus TaxID=42192 RepID=A0A6J8A1L5_MYTCO|nr:unnamed protein product [Mytilus coruscus]
MAQESANKCDICKEDIGKVFCYECRHFLCKSCNSWHEKFPATKRHTVTDSHSVDRSTLMLKLVCADHNLQFAYYCRDCRCLICAQCVTSVHKGHSITDIMDIAAESREVVKKRLSTIQNSIKILADLIEDFKTTKQTKLQTDTDNFIKEIKEVSQDLTYIIETVTEINLTQASDVHALEKQELLYSLAKLEKSYCEYNSLHERCEQVLKEKHDASFFLIQESLIKEFELLDHFPIPEEPKEIKPFKRDDFIDSIVKTMEGRFHMIVEDPNRPMKIAEKMTELFDNDWIDSMEALEELGFGEEECVKIELHFLTDSYEECGRLVAELDSHIEKAVAISGCEQDTNKSGDDKPQSQNIPKEVLKQMKDLRRKLTENNVEKLQKKLPEYLMKTRNLTEQHISACYNFVAKCIKYAWMMQIQVPPVYLEWDFHRETHIDTDIFRRYTKTGDLVDFIVWPVLYLFKDGPVLNKGVVQPKSANK